jgi:hypothetical protein
MVTTLLLPALALAQPAAPNVNPRLASLGIEIWPEYDRPSALVILKGALAEAQPLPAKITLRLPASAGVPLAVAYSATADGSLLNLQHELDVAGEFGTLKFEAPQRFFHVEFYEPIATATPARAYRYVWPGDLAVDRVSVTVQEPATATDIAVEPNLDLSATGQEGLQYRSAELGALKAGKALLIAVRYTKVDQRTSAEILKLKVTAPAPAAAIPAQAAAATAATTGGLPEWALPLAGSVLLSLLGVAVIVWQWRRTATSARPGGSFCAKCGAAQVPDNRFCGSCGAKLG